MPVLALKFKNKSIGKYQLKKGMSLTIGRREDNDVVIDEPSVSGHHAKIDALGDRFVLIDLKSKNGSFVNEQLVDSHWLKDEDIVTIGGHSLVLDFSEDELRRTKKRDDFDETQVMNSTDHRQMMARSRPNRSISAVKFWDKTHSRGSVRGIEPQAAEPQSQAQEASGILTYLAGGSGQIKLAHKITTIGKDPSSDIVVKGMLVDPTTATIKKEPDGCYLRYISGLAKPKVNEKPVTESTLLQDLDIIEIGSVRLQFSNQSPT
ncbi:MAG: FHA domain-containing protein [Deltaproteobacteria bacterium]|nr:FHA domain-containing protein [Deltaproteobacteria bacterium]